MDGVSRWFEIRGEIPLVAPARLRAYAPLSDDPERDSDFSVPGIAGVAFAMEYCDSRGWFSTRAVRCLGFDPRAPASLSAFCATRQATRTFRVDRIISIMELRSGRMLSGEEHVALLAPYLDNVSGDLQVAAMRVLQEATRDGVCALLQLAMRDGRLGAGSRELVLDYLRAEAAAAAIPMPDGWRVELWIDNLAPPLDAVLASVRRLLDAKDRFVRLLPWLLKAVRSQDDFAAQERQLRDLIAEVRLHFRRKLMEPARTRAG